MKQTAVEFLESQYKFHGELYETAIEQAKEMEQEQSIDFARLCLNKAKDLDILTSFMNAQQYYNENFKQQ
jgi:20S proteasome alpha/beta subunit